MVLPPTESARLQKSFRVLKIIVESLRVRRFAADRRRDDFAFRQGRAIANRGDADAIIGGLDDYRIKSMPFKNQLAHLLDKGYLAFLQIFRIGTALGQHDELCQIDGISALAENFALRTFLPALPILQDADAVVGYIVTDSGNI